ncbi:hypothetical protein PHMEG_0007199 [Phytophthora megakarya]|uniref:Uncharacterized protein n=1 Tax=Phytophthora megakarya TaxID=4795 RepID=A0A225WLX5_9STRA|nr:hypothetical protein PHMEG_0007199 [Phytophthora megakarya]
MSHQKAVEEMCAKRESPWRTYEDFLQRQPVVPSPPPTLPNVFKGITTNTLDDPIHALWRLVETQYGLSNVAGVIGLVKPFDEIINTYLKSITELFQDLHSMREQLIVVKVLTVLPKHLWGFETDFLQEKFTLERVADKLSANFGTRSKSKIYALASAKLVNHVEAVPAKLKSKVLGKPKAFDRLWAMCTTIMCHYCGGEHNKMNGIGPHRKVNGPKLALDVVAGVDHRNIWSRPSAKLRKPKHEPTPKMNAKPTEISNAYSPEEEGSAERDHPRKLDRVRCPQKDGDMERTWWPEALM